MGIVGCERDSLAAEPVADVIRVTVDESDANRSGENIFQVFDEVGPDEVASLLEGVVDLRVGLSIVEVHAEGILDFVLGKVVDVVARRGGVLGWVADVISAAAAEDVVRALYGTLLRYTVSGWYECWEINIPTLSRHMLAASVQIARSDREVRLVVLQLRIWSWHPLGMELANFM
jgi:hypothetical protein